ncbi:acetyl-CoA hydrolase/transferase family protein [Fundicoccus culcitae]|uniref:4-hydroxybutyrate CoA-transferase n=1 Tax=Fundicoccus culcitae TaxID=2969821 RepID=A0ABY5P9E1_9LACT|nr:acetyl-CoA hydrolase/transferase C-terminal domain-containing protein [Fundicoccus culcitae]UUX34978.1 4-hydroxybutyrate CoA-transferase [Fundicoccus culcitae]
MTEINYITVQEGLDKIKDGMHVVTGLGCSEAQAMLTQIHTISDRINQIRISNCLSMVDYEFMHEEYSGKFLLASWFYSRGIQGMHDRGDATFIPNNLHLAGEHFLATNTPDIYIGACSSIDKHGYVSLSTGNTYERKMMDAADIVILETNPNYPRTFGDVQVHYSEVDFFIQADHKVPELPVVEPKEKDEIIGKYIADFINDGDCIQLGIGGIPNAVAKSLYGKKDLGVHTEMLTAEVAKLAKAGVITGKNKQSEKGKIVTTFIMGDQELYDFVDDNPAVMVLDGNYVNNPYNIAKNDNQVSINTTLEVDLTGQCASESIGSRQFSGTGGQVDTVRGANYSKGGRSFIALYSTYMKKDPVTGERVETSKIVSQLTPGAAVTLQRNDVDYLVTEYGVAHLKGKNSFERIKSIINIAHPKFRDELLQQAIDIGLIGEHHAV